MVTQKWVQEEDLQARLQRFAKNIHRTVLALDSELGVAVDGQYRETLVKIVYALREIEEWIQREGKPAKKSRNSILMRKRIPRN